MLSSDPDDQPLYLIRWSYGSRINVHIRINLNVSHFEYCRLEKNKTDGRFRTTSKGRYMKDQYSCTDDTLPNATDDASRDQGVLDPSVMAVGERPASIDISGEHSRHSSSHLTPSRNPLDSRG